MTRLLYIILLIAAAIFYPLYEDDLSYITLITLIIIPAALLCQIIISSVFLKCRFSSDSKTCFKGNESELCIEITNNSVFPLSNTAIKARVVFEPTGEEKTITATVPIPALRTETITVNIGAEHCGKVSVFIEYVKIFDLLRLFSVKRFKNKLSGTMYIIPPVSSQHAPAAAALMQRKQFESESELYSDHPSHDRSGDVIAFRDFAPSDKLSLIHYKLSSRFDKDIVKVYSTQNSNGFLLYSNFEQENFDPDAHDMLLEKLMSCGYYLNEYGAKVFIALPENSSDADIYIGSTPAAELYDGASYISCARSSVCGGSPQISSTKGFITEKISLD